MNAADERGAASSTPNAVGADRLWQTPSGVPPFSMSSFRYLVWLLLASLWTDGPARGQCQTEWLPGFGMPGANDAIHALAEWDPDGPGPAHARLVLAGDFDVVGDLVCDGIATFDPATGSFASLADQVHPYFGETVPKVSGLAATGTAACSQRARSTASTACPPTSAPPCASDAAGARSTASAPPCRRRCCGRSRSATATRSCSASSSWSGASWPTTSLAGTAAAGARSREA